MRVFIDHGDRTDRNKARLKYVLDAWGFEKFLARSRRSSAASSTRVAAEALAPRPAFDRAAHIGVHAQKQAGLNWIGVVLPVGKLTAEQMRGLAEIARDLGDGDIRLTVWQNLLISGVPTDKVAAAPRPRSKRSASPPRRRSIRAGLVACTGNTGCRSPPPTPRARRGDRALVRGARRRSTAPVNIHLTGCHHSCAQHYIGDIGLLACKVQTSEDGDTVEGYHIHVGGGFGPDAALGASSTATSRPRTRRAPSSACSRPISRTAPRRDETFLAFTRRHEIDALQAMFDAEAAA